MSRKTNRIFAAAWILFVISLFLPAVEDMFGWHCAATCAGMITDLDEWSGVYYFVFTFPNLLMLLSPLLVYWLKRRGRGNGWLNGIALFCALYILAFGLINGFSGGFSLKTGYYLWLVSFWLLFLGFVWVKRGSYSIGISPPQSREAAGLNGIISRGISALRFLVSGNSRGQKRVANIFGSLDSRCNSTPIQIMKTLVLPALGLLFLTACHTPCPYSSAPPDAIVVQLRGTPGLNVCGDYYIDGVKQTLHGQVPLNIRAVGREFHCDFNKTGTGDLKLVLNHGCKTYGAATAITSNGGVKAELKDGDSFVMSALNGY